MDEETKQSLMAMETRILGRIENTETKLLRAFMGWGRATDAKLRITELERKLLEKGL
jgi:hypothetical protein